jgi:endoglucanase
MTSILHPARQAITALLLLAAALCPCSAQAQPLATAAVKVRDISAIPSWIIPRKALSMLHADGNNVVDSHGNVILLRGVNLGGWLVIEPWMTPADSSKLPDEYSILRTLDQRFGVATEQSLIDTYQNAWITAADLDNIKAAGLNMVRVPVWWANFETLDGRWRSDAFDKLDWVIKNCYSRGIYVVIDLHGVPGQQSKSMDTGRQNQNQYWTNAADQAATVNIWQRLASHYKGNGTVAGYDVMNEPVDAPGKHHVWDAYNQLYSAIRANDPDHMIILEGTFGDWDWSMLPPPDEYAWKNVMYQMHEYEWAGTVKAVESGCAKAAADAKSHQSWNVPGWMGEFNDFGAGTAAWSYCLGKYEAANMSWSFWSYKAVHGAVPDSWGLYDKDASPPPIPNIQTDSAETIRSDWSLWTTANAFALNPMIARALRGR